jgi:hypothetical protein
MGFPANQWAFVDFAIVPIRILEVDGLFNDAHWYTFIFYFNFSSGLKRKVIMLVLFGKLLHQLDPSIVDVIGLLASLFSIFSQWAADSRSLYEFYSSIHFTGELDWHVAQIHLGLEIISQTIVRLESALSFADQVFFVQCGDVLSGRYCPLFHSLLVQFQALIWWL